MSMLDTHPPRLLIGGELQGGSGGSYAIVNPATEEVVGEAPEAGPSEVSDAIAAARGAFDAWSQVPGEERARLLHRVADLVEERRPDLTALAQAETGTTMATAEHVQLAVTIRRLRRYAQGALEDRDVALPPQPVPPGPLGPGALIGAVAARRPVGVVACISPYNFPIGTTAGKVGPALAMGNTVVVKPAPQDPLAVLALGELFVEAGFPPGVVNVLSGSSPDLGEALVASPDVDMVSFTGSSKVGRLIAEAGGRTMKRLLLELGGKGAAVVFEDADVDQAVGGIMATYLFMSGQGCVLPTRAVVHRSVYDAVVERLAERGGALQVGDPLDPATVVGPVISAAQRQHIEGLVASARDEGAEVVLGGRRPDIEKGFFVSPTLVAGARPDMRLAQQEAFGPVVCALPFDDEDEAVAIANGTDYGLNNYVFSGDEARAYRVAARLRSGTVCINTTQVHPEGPFGGFKHSGIGRDGGSFGLDAYSEQQTVVWV